VQQGGDLLTLALIKGRKNPFALRGQRKMTLATVGGRCRAPNQPLPCKFAQDTAEVAGVKPQILAEAGGGLVGRFAIS
jgi:hypothetical protein